MRYRYIHYNLEHGYIHNWLVAGPQEIPIPLEQYQEENIHQQVASQFYDPASGITQTPVERGPLTKGLFKVGDYSGSWNYLACRDDHMVDHSRVYPYPVYLRSWAYTQLPCKAAQEVLLVLTSFGPVDIWLNEQHIHRQEHFSEQQSYSTLFKASLVEGINKIIVRFEGVAIRPCAHAFALQVYKFAEGQPNDPLEPYPSKAGIHVTIPSLIQAISRRNTFEQVSATAYISQDVYEGGGAIYLHWPADLEEKSYTTVRLIASNGQFYAEADVDGTPGDKVFLGYPYQIPEGLCRIVMMPRPWEFYEKNTRITREIPLWNLGRSRYSASPYGTYAERRQEVLVSAIERAGLFAEIGKMALGQWNTIKPGEILQAAQKATPVDLIGLLGMMYRFSENSEYPKELVQPVEECILNYQYHYEGIADRGSDHGESQQILSYACEILAGQRYPKRTFTRSGKSGRWHRAHGEAQALEWLLSRGATGFGEWDSSTAFAEILTALSHLVDLAETESVWEMAAVVMDKLFTTIAFNSYQGVLGSTHGRTYAPFVKGGFLEPTSGITRLMWGMGIYNHHIFGQVSLACITKYELPSMINDIAISILDEFWSQERHAVNAGQVVNKVTYKTPDTMLCSAQDYRPGEKGSQEHIWQATLGPAATVFVTHPACTSEDDSRQPNFWVGNAILPRVAQWKDVLIGVYQLPVDDWMSFTHAYFPTYAFDAYHLREGWAFARKGDGYLALRASLGFDLIQRGHYAYRELRSYGQHNIWLCQTGRAAMDGDFKTFQEKMLTLPVKFEDLSVLFTTLRGESLSFGWQGPFLRDGQEQPLAGFEHYANPFTITPYPSQQMEIQVGEDMLRLNFGNTPSPAT